MKEVTYEEWQKNPIPRMMWCWDEYEIKAVKRIVLYLFPEDKFNYNIIALDSPDSNTCNIYCHCAEIEEPKYRRMTKQELTWWLQDGIKEGKHREWKFIDLEASVIHNTMFYIEEESNDLVGDDIRIRENDEEWHEPLVEVPYL